MDDGVAPDEGLAFIYEVEQAPHLFLERQPSGTTGLARRLNPFVNYLACRWNYHVTPINALLTNFVTIRAQRTGRVVFAFPADWGPHEDTGRVADVSQGAMRRLGISTDDIVEISFPAREGLVA